MLTPQQKEIHISVTCRDLGFPMKYLEPTAFDDCQTKQEINRKLIGEIIPRLKDNIDVTLPQFAKDFLVNLDDVSPAKRLRTLEQTQRSRMQNVVRFRQEWQSAIHNVLAVERDILQLMNLSPKEALETTLVKIQEAGRWEIIACAGKNIICRMRNDCMVAHEGTTLNFGKYEAHFNVDSGRIEVKGGALTHSIGGYIHPHVDTSGGVCWGNASEAVEKALTTFDLHTALENLHLILNQYNAESPYVRWARWQQAAKPQHNPLYPHVSLGEPVEVGTAMLHNPTIGFRREGDGTTPLDIYVLPGRPGLWYRDNDTYNMNQPMENYRIQYLNGFYFPLGFLEGYPSNASAFLHAFHSWVVPPMHDRDEVEAFINGDIEEDDSNDNEDHDEYESNEER